MADDWDLYAVVRNCTTTTTTTKKKEEDPFHSLDSVNFQSDDNPFYFPSLVDNRDYSFEGLDEIYKDFHFNKQPMISTSLPILKGFGNPQQIQPVQLLHQQKQHLQLKNSLAASSCTFYTTNSLPIRSRRRKNEQKKMVRQMTQEELSTDSWAWRKYGQKPIKGSPYPRNYYRCSTSKGCAAKKQVERSPTDSNIFVVSYTGDHTHPRPTHRSSLAGSTRNKPTTDSSSIAPPPTSSFSPITPLIEGEKEAMDVEDDDEAEEDDILIPNNFMVEDMFKDFEELRRN